MYQLKYRRQARNYLARLPVKTKIANEFHALLDRLEDEADWRDIREAGTEPIYDQKEAEDYIF